MCRVVSPHSHISMHKSPNSAFRDIAGEKSPAPMSPNPPPGLVAHQLLQALQKALECDFQKSITPLGWPLALLSKRPSRTDTKTETHRDHVGEPGDNPLPLHPATCSRYFEMTAHCTET